MLWLSLAAALLPALILVWWFATRDAFPEPIGRLLQTFFLGVLVVIPVLLFAAGFQTLITRWGISDPIPLGLAHAFLTAAIPEELFKLLVVAGVCARWRDFDEPMDGLVYGAVAALGFAAFENVFYVVDGGLGLALLRAVTAVPAHACMGVLMGHFVQQARFNPGRRRYFLGLAFLWPMMVHGLYDAGPLILNATPDGQEPGVLALVALGGIVLVLLPLFRWTRRTVRLYRAAQLAPTYRGLDPVSYRRAVSDSTHRGDKR